MTAARPRLLFGLAAACFLAGCDGMQSMLSPHGPQAHAIATISWVIFAGSAAILLLVMGLTLYAMVRRARARADHLLIVGGGIVFPVVTLSALLAWGVVKMDDLRSAEAPALRIEVVGNRWWWDVHYLSADGQRLATAANEIRMPAGVPVQVAVRSNDVIHSFWVPNLAGKIDMIPGHDNRITLQADRPGRFRGQCAEFCGAQHARMAFWVIALPEAEFARWLQHQQQPAAAPASDLAQRGREAFLAQDCVACHTVQGVGSARQRGPDLTHVGSREFLAAGTLPNSRDNLARFIADSQRIKPGNGMPSFAELDAATLDAIAAYLEGLQ